MKMAGMRMKMAGIEKILQIGEIPYPEIMSMNPLPEIRNMKILLEMTRMKIHQIDEMMRMKMAGIRMKMAGIQKIFEIQIGEIPYPETRNIVENSHPETKNMMILPEMTRNMKILLAMTRMKIHQIDEMMRMKMAGIQKIFQIGEIPYPETRNIVESSHPETKNMMILPEMTRMKIHPKAEMMIKMAGMKRYVQLVQSFARGMKLEAGMKKILQIA